MNHTEYALKKAKIEPKKRHHKSKNYKRKASNGDVVVDMENPDYEVMKDIAKDWFNSWDNTALIKPITNGYLTCKTEKEKDDFLDYYYHYFAKKVPGWLDLITPTFFKFQFDYIIPRFLKPWIKEDEMSKKKKISGELQLAIVQFLHGSKSIYASSLFTYLDDLHYFESNVKATVTKMIKSGYISKKEGNGKEFYSIGNVEFYKGGYYV